METIISEQVKVFEDFAAYEGYLKSLNGGALDNLNALCVDSVPTRINIQNEWYESIPISKIARSMSNEDEKYHLVYMQINFRTKEYYIGIVNRSQWKKIQKYQGSGVNFRTRYQEQAEEFTRYYIAICKNSKDAKALEAKIVNHQLIKDPQCLNKNLGGGGGNIAHDLETKGKKTRDYMLAHPEAYQAMLKVNQEMFKDGSVALANRNKSIKKTMSQDKYCEMSSKRMKNWQAENPKAYAKARANNKKAMQSDASKQKRNKALKKWREENPEEYAENKKRQIAAAHSKEAEEKRGQSLKAYNQKHPEIAKMRAEKSKAKLSKAVLMLDLDTGVALMEFPSQHAAAAWLVEQGIARSLNCVSSISAVCLKKRTQTQGYGWRFKE